MAVDGREELGPCDLTRTKPLRAFGNCPNLFCAGFIQVALGYVRRIEINHERSRISEIIEAESTWMNGIRRISASRFGKGLARVEVSNAVNVATGRPRSVMTMGARFRCAFLTQ
jgi:hypothetical protein